MIVVPYIQHEYTSLHHTSLPFSSATCSFQRKLMGPDLWCHISSTLGMEHTHSCSVASVIDLELPWNLHGIHYILKPHQLRWDDRMHNTLIYIMAQEVGSKRARMASMQDGMVQTVNRSYRTTDVVCVIRSLPVKNVGKQGNQDNCYNGRKTCSLDDGIHLHDASFPGPAQLSRKTGRGCHGKNGPPKIGSPRPRNDIIGA